MIKCVWIAKRSLQKQFSWISIQFHFALSSLDGFPYRLLYGEHSRDRVREESVGKTKNWSERDKMRERRRKNVWQKALFSFFHTFFLRQTEGKGREREKCIPERKTDNWKRRDDTLNWLVLYLFYFISISMAPKTIQSMTFANQIEFLVYTRMNGRKSKPAN